MDIAELFNHSPELETARLKLRPPKMEDAPDMFEYASDPQVVRYVTFGPHLSISDTEAMLQRILGRPLGTGIITLAMVLKETGKMVGMCGIHLDSARHARGEVAYVLNKAYWGNGLTTGAVAALIGYGFSELHRIQALCRPENAGSARVMEKAGMSCEGLLRGYLHVKGEYWDVKMYAIIKEECECSRTHTYTRSTWLATEV